MEQQRTDTGPGARGVAPALRALRDEVARVRLGLATAEAAEAQRSARAVVEQVDDYLLPRLEQLDAPLLTVVGGSTGAGKSTLVNAVVGRAGVEPPACCARPPAAPCWSARRPTGTGSPATGCCPAWPGSPARAPTPAPARCGSSSSTALPSGLALLDAPDVDSVVASQPRPRRAAAGRGRPVGVRHHRRPLRRRRAVGPAAHRSGAGDRARGRARPGAARGGRRRSPTTCAACSPGAGLDGARLFVVRGAGCRTAGCPTRRSRAAAGVAARAGRRRGGAGGGGPADAGRRAGQPGRPGRRARRGGRPAGRRGGRAGGGGAGRVRARAGRGRRGRALGHPAARRGAGPVAGLRRHRRVDAQPRVRHRPAARPAAARRSPAGGPSATSWRARWRAASSSCCGRRPTGRPSAPRRPGGRRAAGRSCSATRARELERASPGLRGGARPPRSAPGRATCSTSSASRARASAAPPGCCRSASTAPGWRSWSRCSRRPAG